MRRVDWRRRIQNAVEGGPQTYRSQAGDWTLEFVAPDRFRLRHLADEWIDVGARHYSFAGFWTDAIAAPQVRSSFELTRWLDVLGAEQPTRVETTDGLLELRYRGGNQIWLDANDRIVKARNALLEQTFTYDGDISIEAPDVLAREVDPNALPAGLLD